MRLGTKIALLLVVSTSLPLIVAELLTFSRARAVAEEQTDALIATRADQVVHELDALNRMYAGAARRASRFSEATRVLEGVPGPADTEQLRHHLSDMSETDDAVLAANLVSASGRIVVSSRTSWDGLDISFRPFFQGAVSGSFVVSDPFLPVPETSTVPVVAYAAPVWSTSGGVAGVVVVLVRANALWEAVRSRHEQTPSGGFSILVDGAGIRLADSARSDLVFHPTRNLDPSTADAIVRERRFGVATRALVEAPAELPDVMRLASSPSLETAQPFRTRLPGEQAAAVVVARRLSTVNWTLFHVVPAQAIDAPVERIAAAFIPATLLGLVAILGALVAARRALRPAAELANAVDAVARGETARVVVDASDELGHLASRFNEMAEAVQSARSTLEVRVRDRTEELRRANQTLEVQRRELEAKNAQVERADRLKSQFLANMSHEVRTPLNAIIGFAELLAEQAAAKLSHTEARYLDDVQASGRHLLQLINDILDLSKIEAGQVELQLDDVSPAMAIAEACALMLPSARKRRVELRPGGDGAPRVRADARRLRQILLNLISNAMKFAPEGSSVEIEATAALGSVRFCVRDRGPGIDERLGERLFEPFVQGESPLVKKHQGTGLGLAICLRLVRMHGGSIGVDSTPGGGASFHFTIPTTPARPKELVLERSGATTAAGGPGRSTGLPPSPPTGGSVLVIDDNELGRELATALLERRGWRVRVASSGTAGLSMVHAERPDLIVCDLAMPELDGIAVAHALKSDPATSTIPLVALSAHAMRGVEEDALAAGFDAYVAKPVDRGALDAAISTALTGRGRAERAG